MLMVKLSFPINNEVKCLRYGNQICLLHATMVERIQKAFFQFGSISVFQGNLSPVVLLYGVENWITGNWILHVCKLPEEVGMLAKEDSEAASESTVSKYCSLCSSWLAFHPLNLYG